MIYYDEAKQRALEQLSILRDPEGPPLEPAIFDERTVELPWGWVFYWNTRLYLETGDFEHAVFGNPPLVVNRRDGSVTTICAEESLKRELRRYERRTGIRPWWKFW